MTLQYIVPSPKTADGQPRSNSPAVRAGDFIYISGQVPVNAEGAVIVGGIEAQTRQVMENIKAVLHLAGATFDDVCKCTCWLDDVRDFRVFNRVYLSYFPNGLPARSCVQSPMLIDVKLEIEAIAYKPLH